MMPHGVRGYIKRYTLKSLPDSCVIEVQLTVAGDYGQNVLTWVEVVTTRCRLIKAGQSSTEEAEEFAGQNAIHEEMRLIVASEIGLDVGQRVTVNSEIYYISSLDIGLSDKMFRAGLLVRKVGADG